jgi:hypothetical protein
MAKLIISGDLKEQDIWTIAKFFREFWKHRPEKIFFYISEGTAHLTSEQVQGIFKKIFTDDKDWTISKIDQELIDKFKESIK